MTDETACAAPGIGAMTRLLDDFEGRWRIARRITHAHGPPGAFSGTATWSRIPRGLAYHEQGELHVPGHRAMRAERRYVWRPDLTVWFDNGRFFHQVPARGGQTGHWCPPDQYDVTYEFETWPRFRVVWRVKGPAKDYTMLSDYTPNPAP